MESSSIATRYLSLCQQNRHHSMSSLTKIVLSALEDLVSSRFSMFDNISNVMIWISTTAWQHFMRTYIIIFGVRPNLVISCCIPAIPRFILQSDVKDT